MVSQNTLIALLASAGVLSVTGYEYVGCYTDDDNRDLQRGPMRYGYTKATCSQACADYNYFALQNNGWCVCGDDYGTEDQYSQRPDSECGSDRMGRGWRNAVFAQGSVFSVDSDGLLKYNGGYVCDDSFDDAAARMICAEMGQEPGSFMTRSTLPNDNFLMDDLRCPDGATSLGECTYSTSHNCGTSEGVKLFCTAPFSIDTEGRLMYKDGYVCDDAFTDHAARMVCREMGMYFVSHGDASLPGGSRNYRMDDLTCPEGATYLHQCTHTEDHNCWSYEAVALTCTDEIYEFTTNDCSPGFEHINTVDHCRAAAIALGTKDVEFDLENVGTNTGSGNHHNCMLHTGHGREHVALTDRPVGTVVQPSCNMYGFEGCFCVRDDADVFKISKTGMLQFNAGYVCDDSFGTEEGQMICATLGLRYESHATRQRIEHTNFSMDDLQCDAGATSLEDCTYDTSHNCGSHEAVQLTCASPTPAPTTMPSSMPTSSPSRTPTQAPTIVMFPQPIDSDFWTACASVGTIAKGKIVHTLSRVTLEQCAAACTYMTEETNRPDLECDQWHYNTQKRKCTLRKRNAKTETIVHGQAGRESRREISGNKACAFPAPEYLTIGSARECLDANKKFEVGYTSNIGACAAMVLADEECAGTFFELRSDNDECRCLKNGKSCEMQNESNAVRLYKIVEYDGFANVWEHIPQQSEDFWDGRARRMEQAVDDHLKAPLN